MIIPAPTPTFGSRMRGYSGSVRDNVYGAINALNKEGGEIIGMKAGAGWTNSAFGLGDGRQKLLSGMWAGWKKTGLIDAGRHAKNWLGIGYNRSATRTMGGLLSQADYLKTIGGTGKMLDLAGTRKSTAPANYKNLFGGILRNKKGDWYGYAGSVTPHSVRAGIKDSRRQVVQAGRMFRNRKIVAGVGAAGAAYAISNTFGLVDTGMAAGMAIGGATVGRAIAGRKWDSSRSRSIGGKIGGGLGAVIGGLKMAGVW
jgi:hypothetical protein